LCVFYSKLRELIQGMDIKMKGINKSRKNRVIRGFKANNSKDQTILFIQDWNNFGDRIYSYTKIPSSKISEIQKKFINYEKINIRDYGVTIAAGTDEPTTEIHKEIEIEYNIEPLFME